ncbi:hypothetical protein KBB12_03025 [Candidatus Woesebacteria bacterium]|nr:hypothetical protein [Candidatus Woesebacteria bacterium]
MTNETSGSGPDQVLTHLPGGLTETIHIVAKPGQSPAFGKAEAEGPLVIPEQLMRELDYLAELGDQIGEQVRDTKAMLLAASERRIVLSPATRHLLEQMRPAVEDGMEVRLLGELREVGKVKTAIYQDGVAITADQMVDLRSRADTKTPPVGPEDTK